MIHTNCRNLELAESQVEGARGVRLNRVISQEAGAPNFALRLFAIEPSGHTPRHHHEWEHEVYIRKGTGRVFLGGEERLIEEGDVLFIPGGLEHQFLNDGENDLEFLCMVPHSAQY